MPSVAHHNKYDPLLTVSPTTDSCWSIVSKAVVHLAAGAGSIKPKGSCITVIQAFHSFGELFNDGLGQGSNIFR